MRVEVATRAQWELGLIERKHRTDAKGLAEIRVAYFAIISELRSSHPSIWSMASDKDPDAFVYYHPPLHGHFRMVEEGKVTIFSFTEMSPEIPGGNDAE